MTHPTTVAIIGAGTIGASWAAFYASKGLSVSITDSDAAMLERGLARAKGNLNFLCDKDLIDADTCRGALARLRACPDLATAAGGAQFVHEAVAENYEAKKQIFGDLDRLTPPATVLASSSSGLLMTEIQQVMEHPGRALIAHPFNPPHLVPLVELVGGEQTDPAVLQRARNFFESLGKVPVMLKKEVPGHIANRLAAALWREAIDLVASGVASVEDVDKALHAGPGIRWAFMGQHLIYHLGGGEGGYEAFIRHIGKAFEHYYEGMAAWTEIPENAKQAVIDGVREEVGDRSLDELAAWRDDRLVKLLKTLE